MVPLSGCLVIFTISLAPSGVGNANGVGFFDEASATCSFSGVLAEAFPLTGMLGPATPLAGMVGTEASVPNGPTGFPLVEGEAGLFGLLVAGEFPGDKGFPFELTGTLVVATGLAFGFPGAVETEVAGPRPTMPLVDMPLDARP